MAPRKVDIRLIVGLGNPGDKYARTRHNAGFWLLDRIAADRGATLRPETRFHGDAGRFAAGGRDVHLLRPGTFMNRSGQSVAALCRYFRISPEQILVLHDELDLAPGDNRLKLGGGHGGHNGLRDIINQIGRDFLRLRIGIGHPGDRNRVVNYVLKPPSREELAAIEEANERSLNLLPLLLDGRLDPAMQQLHSKPE
jgi:PTH1 family peptidyl-tRNA hydrolase